MTDKEQIISDGVDVNECDFFIKNRDKYLCRCTKINSFGDIVTPKNAENSNCLDNYHCYYKQLARKTQECELLETQLESYHIGEAKLVQRIQELEHECEDLKKQLETSEKWRIESDLQNARYRWALEEIEEELKEDMYCESQECGCDDFEECLKCTKEHILDIISRAKGK